MVGSCGNGWQKWLTGKAHVMLRQTEKQNKTLLLVFFLPTRSSDITTASCYLCRKAVNSGKESICTGTSLRSCLKNKHVMNMGEAFMQLAAYTFSEQ